MLWWIAIIGLGAIFKFIYWVVDCVQDSNENRKELEAKEQEEKMLSTQRLMSSIDNRIAILKEKKDSFKCEILKLRDKQQKILNQFITSMYSDGKSVDRKIKKDS